MQEKHIADEYNDEIENLLNAAYDGYENFILEDYEKDLKPLLYFLHDRGFDQFPVMYYYSVGGNYCGETVAEEASRDRRPIYQTNYMSSEGVLWKIHIVNGDIFASPIVFTQNGSFGTPIVISESSALCSYDNMTDRFFVTVPYPEELKVTVVERLDYTALEDLTVEEITAP